MRAEIRADAGVSEIASAWQIDTSLAESGRPKITSIRELISFPRQVQPISYIESPVLVEASVTALTGDAESGKSTLACAWAKRSGRRALLLDRENSMWGIADRFERLGIIRNDPAFVVWGGWQLEEAPAPFSPIIIRWVMECEPRPIIIIDSLSAFYEGNQNDAESMRAFMHQCRRLADLGATVVLIHHDGKAETAKDYRGSSDFKAAIDCGLHVSNISQTRLLERLMLRPYKSRFGLSGSVMYSYDNGAFTLAEELEPRETVTERLTALLRQHPGINGSRFENLAGKQGASRSQVRAFLAEGRQAGIIDAKTGSRNAVTYALSGSEFNHD